MLNRRAFLYGTISAALAVPGVVEAQQSQKMPRIGFLGPPPGTGGQLVESFRQGLRELGYIDGQNITIEYRWTDVISSEPGQLDVLAAELVGLQVDVLVASITSVILAAKRATSTIPIVMANAADPVGSGLVAGLARPGGNVTGVARLVPDTVSKELELLTDVVQGVERVGVLSNPYNLLHTDMLSRAHREAAVLGIRLAFAEASVPTELQPAVDRLRRQHVGGVLILADGMFFLNCVRLSDVLLRARLPSMFGNTEHVEAGGLMSYAASSRENYRRAAHFVDKILKGAKPIDLPVEQPTKFELVINLKTARALGLTIPPSLLLAGGSGHRVKRTRRKSILTEGDINDDCTQTFHGDLLRFGGMVLVHRGCVRAGAVGIGAARGRRLSGRRGGAKRLPLGHGSVGRTAL